MNIFKNKFYNFFRVDIFVNTQGSCPYEFETKLKKIFQYFQLEKNLNLKLLNDSFNENRLSFEQKLRNLNTNYLAEPNIVDFTKILNDFDLKFYDQNLHYGNSKIVLEINVLNSS